MQKFLYLFTAALIALPATVIAPPLNHATLSDLQQAILELSEELETLHDRCDLAERHRTLDPTAISTTLRSTV